MDERKVIALGFFDGVHKGHGALFQKAVERAAQLGCTAAAFTFDRAPKEAVSGVPLPLINSLDDRKALIGRLYGIECVIVEPFDEKMMTMHWEAFIETLLCGKHRAVHLVAGHDFRFGHKNEGTVEKLAQKCRELSIGCDIVEAVMLDGVTCSSTHIRGLLEKGDVHAAADFLGHPHCLTQTVAHGRRIGRTIGVPTVNLTIPEKVITPAFGVYAARVILPDGTSRGGVTNVGVRPTVDGRGVTVETFILDFDGDLYGEEIRIEFLEYLRAEQKFPTLDDLRAQIARDSKRAADILGREK